MVYLFESKLPENKSVYYGLTSTYGVGKSRSFLICKKVGLSLNLKIKDLSTSQIHQIIKVVESSGYVIANDLKRVLLQAKQRLISMKSYRGLRRKKGFPIRGQRTHTNAKTAKKNR
jgi:small subunit ribosomal protein S13